MFCQEKVFNENVKQQKIDTMNPVEFVEGVYFNFFMFFIENGNKNEQVECLVNENVENMCEFIKMKKFFI